MAKNKLRVAVVCGGRSGEHEISLRSAASVLKRIDRSRFDVQGMAIDKRGKWHAMPELDSWIGSLGEAVEIDAAWPEVTIPTYPNAPLLISGKPSVVDVFFPVMHGPLCEDGSIQGLFELMDVAYVGCGVLASAVGMDKEVAKRLLKAAGVPVVPWVTARQAEGQKNRAQLLARVKAELGFPVFVKPANLGSSVGVHKVKSDLEFGAALDDAFQYDPKVLIEKAISAREIEVAVLENSQSGGPPLASIVGEIVPQHEFYSYEAKYLDESGAVLKIPAVLDAQQMQDVQTIARQTFIALECEGMSRVDLFLDRDNGQFYLNEINTIPGFTSISMYPKLWEAAGVSYSELLSKLVDLATARHARRARIKRDFHSV